MKVCETFNSLTVKNFIDKTSENVGVRYLLGFNLVNLIWYVKYLKTMQDP